MVLSEKARAQDQAASDKAREREHAANAALAAQLAEARAELQRTKEHEAELAVEAALERIEGTCCHHGPVRVEG